MNRTPVPRLSDCVTGDAHCVIRHWAERPACPELGAGWAMELSALLLEDQYRTVVTSRARDHMSTSREWRVEALSRPVSRGLGVRQQCQSVRPKTCWL